MTGSREFVGRERELGGGAPAFWPWTVLVRALARDSQTAVLTDALGGAAAVAQLVPELRERVPRAGTLPAGDDQDRDVLFVRA